MAPLRHRPSEVHAHLKQNWCTIFRFIYLKEDETQKNFSSSTRRSTLNKSTHCISINYSIRSMVYLPTYRLVSYCSRNDGHSLKKPQRENTSVWLHLKRKKVKRTLSINKTSATILNYLVLQWKRDKLHSYDWRKIAEIVDSAKLTSLWQIELKFVKIIKPMNVHSVWRDFVRSTIFVSSLLRAFLDISAFSCKKMVLCQTITRSRRTTYHRMPRNVAWTETGPAIRLLVCHSVLPWLSCWTLLNRQNSSLWDLMRQLIPRDFSVWNTVASREAGFYNKKYDNYDETR